MAEQGQEELPEFVEENKRHRSKAVQGVMNIFGIKKKKSSQSTPPPSGTTLVWASPTEDFTIDDTSSTDNTPLELTTDSQRRVSGHSRSGQRRKDSDTSRNTPPTVYPTPPPIEQPSHVQPLSSHGVRSHFSPHVPDDVINDEDDKEITRLNTALEKMIMERDRHHNDKQTLERRLSEYEGQLAASRAERRRPQTGPVSSPDNNRRITQLEKQWEDERMRLKREKEELETEYKTRHQKEMDSLTARLEEAAKNEKENELQGVRRQLEEVKNENKRKEERIVEVDKSKGLLSVQVGELKKQVDEIQDQLGKESIACHNKETKLNREKKNAEALQEALIGSHKEQEEIKENFLSLVDLRDISEERGDRIRKLTKEKEVTTKEVAALKQDLAAAQTQYGIFQEELTKTMKEEKRAREVINQLQSEIERNKQVQKSGKNSFNELRRLLDEMKQDLTAIGQQVRAYKRQVNGLTEQLTDSKEKNKLLQQSLDTKTGVERELTKLEGQLHTCKVSEASLQSSLHEKIMTKSKLEQELEKMKNGNKSLHDRLQSQKVEHDKTMADMSRHLETISKERDNTQEAHINIQHQLIAEQDNHKNIHMAMSRDVENMRNSNMVLQQRLREAWLQIDQLQDEMCNLQLSRPISNQEQPVSNHKQHLLPPQQPSSPAHNNTENVFPRSDHPGHQRPNTEYSLSQHHNRDRHNIHPVQTDRERQAGDIKENPVMQGIDREIANVAADIRRQTQPPQTQEFFEDDDDPLLGPYDPNLTCQGCGQRLSQSIHSAKDYEKHEILSLNIQKQQPDEHPSWLLEKGEVVLTKEEIGAGSYGNVRVAMFRGTRVAAKCMHKIILSDYNKQKFIREMNMSASCHHPNIVQFIGAPTDVQYPILLYELMETSLYSLLQNTRAFTHPQIIDIGCNIASALSYLHLSKPHPIIHRDISSPNVLMESLPGDRWRSKLCDFGSAKLQPHAQTKGPGNPHYAAYEAIHPDSHSTAMDIYSFAVLLMEVTLRRQPEGERKSREMQAHTITWLGMKGLVLQCIAEDRFKRPDISHVLHTLRQLEPASIKESSSIHDQEKKAGDSSMALRFARDIKENPVMQGIDREIANVAADIRRQTQPPQTQEFFEDDDDPSLGPFDPNLTCQGCGQRYCYGEIQKLRHHINEFCVARQYLQEEQKKSSKNDIRCHDDIDKEIHHYADEIRRQMQPPPTQEILNDDDDPSLGPYDPNLTCQGCGQRYRYGEIQKLRRHINEFCVARLYTQTQPPRYN